MTASLFYREMWSPDAVLLRDTAISMRQLMEATKYECVQLGGLLEDPADDEEEDDPGQSIFATWPGLDRDTKMRALFCHIDSTDIIVDITKWCGDSLQAFALRQRLEPFIINVSGGAVGSMGENFPFRFSELPRV